MLPFTYTPDHSISCHKDTVDYIENTEGLKDDIFELSWLYHSMMSIIPQTTDNYWSGHNFPFLESFAELQISYNLMLFGLYKQAMVSLRSAMELGLLSVYYNINDDGHKVVQQWLSSSQDKEGNTPRSDKIWKVLMQHSNIQAFETVVGIKDQFMNLNYLHNYVHTKGGRFSNDAGKFHHGKQVFQKERVTLWFNAFKDICEIVTCLHILKYPTALLRFDYDSKFGIDVPSFPHLREFEINRIEKYFTPEFIQSLRSICQTDPSVIQFQDWLNSKPDITDDQVDDQIFKLDTMMARGKNIEEFIKSELAKVSQLTDEIPQRVFNRMDRLRKWAKENPDLIKDEEE